MKNKILIFVITCIPFSLSASSKPDLQGYVKSKLNKISQALNAIPEDLNPDMGFVTIDFSSSISIGVPILASFKISPSISVTWMKDPYFGPHLRESTED